MIVNVESSCARNDQGWKKIYIIMKEAFQQFETAKELSLIANDPIGMAKYKANMSVVHYQKGASEQAMKLGVEALSVFVDQEDHTDEICKCYSMIGKLYWDLGARDKGIEAEAKLNNIHHSHQAEQAENESRLVKENLASRMESNGESGAIHVTEAVYHAIKDRYLFHSRGFVDVKGKGQMRTYFLLSKK